MNIIHKPERNLFVAVIDNGHEIGEIEYSPGETPGNIVATHTRVNPDYQGQGVAEKLLDALVAHAQANSLTITPECTYVNSAFRKHPEKYGKVVAKN